MTEKRAEIVNAKRSFVKTMKMDYPDFTEKKWAKTSYRVKHPQRAVSK